VNVCLRHLAGRTDEIAVFNKAVNEIRNDLPSTIPTEFGEENTRKYNVYSHFIASNYDVSGMNADSSPLTSTTTPINKMKDSLRISLDEKASTHSNQSSTLGNTQVFAPLFPVSPSAKSQQSTGVPYGLLRKTHQGTFRKGRVEGAASPPPFSPLSMSSPHVDDTPTPHSRSSSPAIDGTTAVDAFLANPSHVTIPGYVLDALPTCFGTLGNSDASLTSLTTLHKMLVDFPLQTILYAPLASSSKQVNRFFYFLFFVFFLREKNECNVNFVYRNPPPQPTKSASAAYVARLAPPAPKSPAITMNCDYEDFVKGCITLLERLVVVLIIDGNMHVQVRAIEMVTVFFDILLGRLGVAGLEKEKEVLAQSLVGNLSLASTSRYKLPFF
jgi:hypothetical protein